MGHGTGLVWPQQPSPCGPFAVFGTARRRLSVLLTWTERIMTGEMRQRWQEEIDFHDRMAEHDARWTAFRAYGLSEAAISWAVEQLGDLAGKRVLDIGCGDCRITARLLQPDATLWCIDISARILNQGRAYLLPLAAQANASAHFARMAGEQMALDDESVDVVFGTSVLHHMDIDAIAAEIRRVLKPGGHAVFVEPLANNPIAALYRRVTPDRHSEHERPFALHQIQQLVDGFSAGSHREFYLSAPAAAGFALLRSRWLFDRSLSALYAIDEFLFRRLPTLRRFAWISVAQMTK